MVNFSIVGVILKRWRILVVLVGSVLLLATALIMRPVRLTEYPATLHICDNSGASLRTVLDKSDIRCEPVELRAMGEWLPKALIAAEDKRFYQHCGIDLIALTRAVVIDIAARRIVSGASTISTQVIRMNTPRNRTFVTKLLEAGSAISLERHLNKDAILEQYLNRMPAGGNLSGAQAAAMRYFGRDASSLSLAEASLLAGLPQAPSRFRPDRHLQKALRRRKFVLDRMQKLGFISRRQREQAERQPIDITVHHDPFRAPHFCELVLMNMPQDAADSGTAVKTSLDGGLQDIAESVMAQQHKRLAGKAVFGGAVVIIEVGSGKVVAMLGSPDYDDTEHCGRVNCAITPRSPGSALKPFAYAMAFDRGWLTPGSMLSDTPIYFKDYTPRNFDYSFRGKVSVRQALVDSLNIPALTVVRRLGTETFIEKLRNLGLHSLNKPAEYYGLSLVLGTGEVKLLNLANAYAVLANEGLYHPYSLLADEKCETGSRLFSEGACWMIADILSRDTACDPTRPRVAWKTGTSSGGRDAWCVGYNPEYVVAVWLGNPDGSAPSGITGAGDASPLVLDIFRRIYPDGNSPWYERPPEVAELSSDFYMPGVTAPRLYCKGKYINKRTDPNCDVLRIVKPLDGDTFVMDDALAPESQKIELRSTQTGPLSWFVDGAFIKTSKETLLWKLQRGRHEIVCANSSGQSAAINITVE